MKTHIPASLRKALLAALFATVSIASTTYAKDVDYALDVINWSDGYGETTFGNNKHSTGYTDLTFSGTDPSLGTVDHWCHDYNVISIPSHFTDRKGADTGIWVEPDYRTGKYIVHSITADQGKANNTNFNLDDWHDHDSHDEYGYSYSWSNGNIKVKGEAVLEVTTDISAHGTITISDSSQVTAGNKVSAGEIKVTGGQLTAKDISVTVKNLWNPGEDDYDSTGELLVSGSGAEVTATGTVYAEGGVNVSNGAHLNASKITSNVTGSKGYVHALPNQNLVITDAVASEKTQYIVDNGSSITLSGIGLLVNAGTPEEPQMVMHGNGNRFGYGADTNNIKADSIYVLGSIISDNNDLAALGGAVGEYNNAIQVQGSITGNGNKLLVRSLDSAGIDIGGSISGDNNSLSSDADAFIRVGGTLGRSQNDEKGIAKGNTLETGGDITIGKLSDNDGLNIDAMDGEVTIEQAAKATLVNSNISAGDDITIAKDAASTAVLQLTNSHIVSDNGDITIGQYVTADATSSIEAEEGAVNIHGLTANGATVKAVSLDGTQFIRLDGTGTTDTTISVEEDMTSSNGSIFVLNYNGEDPRITVGGDMRAKLIMDIAGANITVGGNQATETDSMSIDGTTLTVGGSQTSGKNLTTSSSKMDVAGDQSAVGRAEIHSTTLNVGGNQTSGKNLVIDSASKVTVGHVDEETGELVGGTQSAGKDIQIANSIVEVLRDQEATNGAITITGGGTVTVGSSRMAVVADYPDSRGKNLTFNTIIVRGRVLASPEALKEAASTAIYGTRGANGAILVIANDAQTGGNQTAKGDITIDASTVNVLNSQTSLEGAITITGGSTVTVGTAGSQVGHVIDNPNYKIDPKETIYIGIIEPGDISTEERLRLAQALPNDAQAGGNQTAKGDITIADSSATIYGDQTSLEGSISITSAADSLTPSEVHVGGNQTAAKDIEIANSIVEVLDTQEATNGNISVSGASTVTVGTKAVAKALAVEGTSQMTVNVATEDLAEGETSVLKVEELTVGADAKLHTGNVELTAAKETIHGVVEAGVKDYSDPTKDIAADWKVTGSHDISGANAHLMANGDIEIVATEEGDTISIAGGAKVSATGDVTIQGLAAALAVVDGATVHATGDIILDNAELKHNTGTDIATKGSDIVLKDTVVIRDTILNVLPPEEGDEGVINVTEDADVQIRRVDIITPSMANVDVFNGKLAGTGSVTAYDDNLTLYHDATAFNGTINLVRDNEQALNIACEGVGEDAVLNLTEGSSLYTYAGGLGAHLGNVNTTDGSHIQLTAVEKGNTATATSLTLTSGTTYDVLATADDTGSLVSDRITVSDGIDANGAKVAVHTTPAMDGMKEGSRFTIVEGEVVTEFDEDVLYDRVRGIGGASTLRKLQTRNMHLEHNANGVDLVVSENYKAVDNSNANVNAVREIIMPLDAAADHRPGVLAQSTSNLDHILDALDYTRSGADAKAGVLSVSAAANLIVPNMMMDASRHHLSNLRDHMNTPVCTKDYKGKGNVWAAYVGGHDFIGSDDNMGKYTHSYNGAIIGGDYAVNCNWAIGLSAGYQNSIARTDATRADADAISGDLYVVGRTGKFVHRFSMGLTSYNTDVKRGTRIAAKGHSYDELSTGDADGMSWNFGYQISRSYAINQVSALTPYLAVDVALQRVDTLTEKGQGDASVVTDYEDFVQTDAALGVSYSHTFASFNRQAGVFAFDLAVHGEFSEHRTTAQNHFVDSPEDTWKTRSAKRAPFYGELGGHVLVPFTRHFSGTAGVNFEFSDDRTYIGGHAGVNYRF
ncbi:MAG: autotransporter domain-containing protein [Akkermansia sp.]|nr:autotransporter domain-containing protein [Akkermansia sp.]